MHTHVRPLAGCHTLRVASAYCSLTAWRQRIAVIISLYGPVQDSERARHKREIDNLQRYSNLAAPCLDVQGPLSTADGPARLAVRQQRHSASVTGRYRSQAAAIRAAWQGCRGNATLHAPVPRRPKHSMLSDSLLCRSDLFFIPLACIVLTCITAGTVLQHMAPSSAGCRHLLCLHVPHWPPFPASARQSCSALTLLADGCLLCLMQGQVTQLQAQVADLQANLTAAQTAAAQASSPTGTGISCLIQPSAFLR